MQNALLLPINLSLLSHPHLQLHKRTASIQCTVVESHFVLDFLLCVCLDIQLLTPTKGFVEFVVPALSWYNIYTHSDYLSTSTLTQTISHYCCAVVRDSLSCTVGPPPPHNQTSYSVNYAYNNRNNTVDVSGRI